MSSRPILITFFDHTDVEDCEARCDTSWAPRTAIDLIKAQLEDDFEGQVTVEYVDLARPEGQSRHSDLARRVKELNLPLPLIAFDGSLKLSGNVEYRTIVEAIEAHQELSRGRSL